jgi:hypothetical protein
LARAWERAGWLLLWEVFEAVEAIAEFGVVLLVGRDSCAESDEGWLLLDEKFETVVLFVSDSGSVLIWTGIATFCLLVGFELSL